MEGSRKTHRSTLEESRRFPIPPIRDHHVVETEARPPLSRLLSLGSFLLLPALLAAQQIGGGWEKLHSVLGEEFDSLGISCSGTGDVDGDGVPDFAAGTPYAERFGYSSLGLVVVLSGADGHLLHLLYGEPSYGNFGWFIDELGDVNGDGFADILTSSPHVAPYGVHYVHSGADGSLIRKVDGEAHSGTGQYGISLAGFGDLNGDGVPDYGVGNPQFAVLGSGDGKVYVYDGAIGAELYTIPHEDEDAEHGTSLANAGDVDGDGIDDILVGAPDTEDPVSGNKVGAVFVYSGASGSLLLRVDAPAAGVINFGRATAGPGDVDGDGTPDLLVGCREYLQSFTGSVFLMSGADGSLLQRWNGFDQDDWYGRAVAGPGDVDGDGVPDLLTSAPRWDSGPNTLDTNRGKVLLYSGADYSLLQEWEGTEIEMRFGSSIGAVGDTDQDGRANVLFGASGEAVSFSAQGSVSVHAFRDWLYPDADVVANSTGGIIQFQIDFPDSEARAQYALFCSGTGEGPTQLGGIDIPLTHDSIFGMFLTGQVPAPFQSPFGRLDAAGDASPWLDIAPNSMSAYLGRTFYFAAVSYDLPSTGRLSTAVKTVTVQP